MQPSLDGLVVVWGGQLREVNTICGSKGPIGTMDLQPYRSPFHVLEVQMSVCPWAVPMFVGLYGHLHLRRVWSPHRAMSLGPSPACELVARCNRWYWLPAGGKEKSNSKHVQLYR